MDEQLRARTVAHIRDRRPDLDDLPDDAIERLFYFESVSITLLIADIATSAARSIAGLFRADGQTGGQTVAPSGDETSHDSRDG